MPSDHRDPARVLPSPTHTPSPKALPYSKIQEGWIRSLEVAYAAVSAFLGVVEAFFGVVFFVEAFFGAAAFFVVGGAVALVLVTRPDLVLVSTLGTSTTAGAYDHVSRCLREHRVKERTAVDGLAVFFALGLAVLAFGLAAAVFLAAGAFLVVVALVADFFGAAFLVVVVAAGLSSLASFYLAVSDGREFISMFGSQTFGAAAALAAGGLASFFASLTGPDGPNRKRVSLENR
jgi:hypothetical protein